MCCLSFALVDRASMFYIYAVEQQTTTTSSMCLCFYAFVFV